MNRLSPRAKNFYNIFSLIKYVDRMKTSKFLGVATIVEDETHDIIGRSIAASFHKGCGIDTLCASCGGANASMFVEVEDITYFFCADICFRDFQGIYNTPKDAPIKYTKVSLSPGTKAVVCVTITISLLLGIAGLVT